jgi:single-stranded DNA-binding protein
MGYNRTVILAQIIADPILQHKDTNKPYVAITGLVEDYIRCDKNKYRLESDRHNFFMIGETAEKFCEKVRKYDNVIFEGRLKPIEKTIEGKRIWTTEFRITHFNVIHPRMESDDVVEKRVDEEIKTYIKFEDLE